MAQGSRQVQTQAQQQIQTLSPQQILVVKLLELPAVELEDRVRAELLENPALEEGKEDTPGDEYPDTPDAETGSEDGGDTSYDSLSDYLNEDDIPDYKLQENNRSKGEQAEEIPFSDATSFYETLRQQLYLQYSAEPQVEVDPTVHFSDLREGKSAQEILQNVTAASLQALQRTSKLMDPAAYQTASDWLLQSKSIKLFGMGASGLVASDLCDKLLRIGKNAIFNFNSHVQLSYSATLTKDDTAVFISNTGKTQEILQALEAVQASGCHTIGITHYSKSPLSAGCKLLLYTSSKEVYVRSGAMSSRLAQLMVVDALFTVLASQDYAAIQGTLESSYQICMSHRVDHR